MRPVCVLLVLAAAVILAAPAQASGYSDAVMSDSPAGYWRLGEAFGAGSAIDASGHGFSGTVSSITSGIDGALDPDLDTAASFAGTAGSQIDLGQVGGFPSSGAFSAEAWVSTMFDGGTLISKGDVWSLYDGTSSSCLGCAVISMNDGGYLESVTGPADSPIDDGMWHHVVATFTPYNKLGLRTISLYVDGVGTSSTFSNNQGRTLGNPPVNPLGNVKLGTGSAFAGNLNGNLDEAAVYNSTLSSARVLAHYIAGTSGPDQSATTLSPTDSARAGQIATSDPRVQQLLGGSGYTVGQTDMWTKSNGVVLGASVSLDLTMPATLSGNWPGITYDPSEASASPYTTNVLNYSSSPVSALNVLVDLRCNAVVEVDPGNTLGTRDTNPTTVSSGGPPPCTPTGGQDPSWVHNLKQIHVGGDWFWNYSFESADFSRLSWPIDLIFIDKHPGDNVNKDALHIYGINPPSIGCPSSFDPCEFDRMSQGGTATWAFDEGSKTEGPGCWSDVHFRVFSVQQTPAYNPAWGYFFPAAAHFDHFEFCPFGHKYFGDNEKAETQVDNKAADDKHWPVFRQAHHGAVFLHNRIFGWPNRSHHYVNDGWASKILVCISSC